MLEIQGNGCDSRLMAKKLITTIQIYFCCLFKFLILALSSPVLTLTQPISVVNSTCLAEIKLLAQGKFLCLPT